MRIFPVALFTILVAAVVSVPAYLFGLSQGAAVPAAGGAVPPPYAYPYYGHFGFGGFGFLFPILFLFLFFAVARGLAGWGRWGGSRMHDGRGWGDGPSRLEDWHRRAHADERTGKGDGAGESR